MNRKAFESIAMIVAGAVAALLISFVQNCSSVAERGWYRMGGDLSCHKYVPPLSLLDKGRERKPNPAVAIENPFILAFIAG